jgi:hypothetical protein
MQGKMVGDKIEMIQIIFKTIAILLIHFMYLKKLKLKFHVHFNHLVGIIRKWTSR